MQVIAVVNKKGGAGKTTTLIGLALGIQSRGHRVGVIDTDPNGSASRWLTDVDLDNVPCDHRELTPLLATITGDYDYVLIDSPPNDTTAITNVANAASLVLIPLAPTGIETDQLADTVQLIPADITWCVVPVRVRMSTSAGRTIRDLCNDNEIPTTRTIVPLSEGIARSFGAQPPKLAFAALTTEILTNMEQP